MPDANPREKPGFLSPTKTPLFFKLPPSSMFHEGGDISPEVLILNFPSHCPSLSSSKLSTRHTSHPLRLTISDINPKRSRGAQRHTSYYTLTPASRKHSFNTISFLSLSLSLFLSLLLSSFSAINGPNYRRAGRVCEGTGRAYFILSILKSSRRMKEIIPR